MIDEAQIMAFLDGDLPPEEASKVVAALSADADLRALMEQELAVRQAVAATYAPVLDQQPPERVMRPFKRSKARVTKPRLGNRLLQGWSVSTALPMAASLLLGLFLGANLLARPNNADTDRFARLDPAIVSALDSRLVAEQEGDDAVQIGVSFVSLDGAICRTYQNSKEGGIACRDGNTWALRLLAPAQAGRAGEMQQAGTASGLVMGAVQDMIAGEPMDDVAERAAMSAGWQADRNHNGS